MASRQPPQFFSLMDEHLKQQLKDYFVTFGAENSLSEPDMEKMERVIHHFSPQTMDEVKKICQAIVHENLKDWTEEEMIAALEKIELFKE